MTLEKGNKQFYKFSNTDGKVWYVPVKNIRTALSIYQPSGIRGKLLKTFLPLVPSFQYLRKKANIEMEEISLEEEWIKKAERAFDQDTLEYSIFLGTPSAHQKVTVQFFKGTNILGYGKFSDKREVKELFVHEKKILEFLHSRGISTVPFCKAEGENQDGTGFFYQDTKKKAGSKSPSKWSREHEIFLSELAAKTSVKKTFNDTDFAKSLYRLQDYLDYMPSEFSNTISKHIKRVLAENEGTDNFFSVYHSDFTPWNMFTSEGSLYVFDWEYASLTYPPFLDKYHFHIQQMIHVDHLSPEEIYRNITKESWVDKKMIRLYLLDIISLYLSREKGTITPESEGQIKNWVSLLVFLEK